MTPDVVVDVGNTRMKTGVRGPDGVYSYDGFSVDSMDSSVGHHREIVPKLLWVVAGSNPKRQAELVQLIRDIQDDVVEITSYKQLPIVVDVDHPEKVGIDRLLGAVAANRRRTPGRAAITVDVGTAVTVNLLDAAGTFTGGLILPGVALMTDALHEKTAKLPRVQLQDGWFPSRQFPGRTTENAICAGVAYAIAGAVRLALEHAKVDGEYPELFLTGGGAVLIRELLLDCKVTDVWTLVLDGLVITAENLP